MKKTLALTLALAMCLTALALPANAADTVTAQPTASTVYINGTAVAFEAYTIAGSNYFKLRDLAYALGGTAKQFAVGYDEATKAVTLTSGGGYTAVGSEMAKGDGKAKTASPTQSKIYLDGRELSLTVYNIGGSNFFKLRDLMEVLNVYVGYDEPTKAITLDTGRGYGQTGGTDKPSGNIDPRLLGHWFRGSISGGMYDKQTGIYLGYKGIGVLQTFNADGTYHYLVVSRGTIFNLDMALKGNWYVENGVIFKTNIMVSTSDDLGKTWSEWVLSSEPELSQKYEIGTYEDSGNEYLQIWSSDGTKEMPFGR